MLSGRTANDFVVRISEALTEAKRQGIYITAGAGSCDLEAQQFARHSMHEEERSPKGQPHHLESPPGPRNLGTHDGTSRLCYFLDGVQSSREIGRIEMVPVIVATIAAAIVNRCDRRFTRMPLRARRSWCRPLSCLAAQEMQGSKYSGNFCSRRDSRSSAQKRFPPPHIWSLTLRSTWPKQSYQTTSG